MRLLLVLCVLSAAFSSCRKKSSPEFYRREADYSILVAREGDDAYDLPQMAAIVAGFEAVPVDALEQPRAASLLADIAAQRQRIKAERAPPPVTQVAAPPQFPTRSAPAIEAEPAGEKEVVDAGPPEPYAGMPEKAFLALFGTCFRPGAPPQVMGDAGFVSAQMLLPRADCQKRFGSPGAQTSYLFTASGLASKRQETITVQVVDAGQTLVPKPAGPPDAGALPPIMVIPGAPLPEGYQ